MTIAQALCAAAAQIILPVLEDTSATYSGTEPDTGTAGFTFQTDGRIAVEEDSGTSFVNWWPPGLTADIGDSYQIRALSAGKTGVWDSAAAADDTWITMDANREWSITSSSGQTTIATFEIRRVGGSSAIDSGVFDAEVEIDSA